MRNSSLEVLEGRIGYRKYTVIRITKGWSSSEMLFLRWSPALFCIMNTPKRERES